MTEYLLHEQFPKEKILAILFEKISMKDIKTELDHRKKTFWQKNENTTKERKLFILKLQKMRKTS